MQGNYTNITVQFEIRADTSLLSDYYKGTCQ